MRYADVISHEVVSGVHKFLIKIPNLNPKPGQFISIIFPNEMEIPLSVADYRNDILEIYVASERIAKRISGHVIIKGPLGREISLVGKVRAIVYGSYFYHILYPLREAKRRGLDVKVYCINCETQEFEKTDNLEQGDTILVSVPLELISKFNLPKDSLVHVSWVKMNCMLGVCGVCEIKGHLACVEGPVMRLSEVVDRG
ncbi:MAG: 2-polyprenylphenol hydroxylase [Sulfolobaceae archaeon]|nr:2-polyprenylphenol hydroxylase [Sulfolobaceae archaeon]